MTQFAQGNWKIVKPVGEHRAMIKVHGNLIATVAYNKGLMPVDANAALIVEAPNLLRMLERITVQARTELLSTEMSILIEEALPLLDRARNRKV